MFFCDRNLNCFTLLRAVVPSITMPFQRKMNWSIDLVQIVSDNLKRQQILLKENALLRSELLLANTQLQRLSFLEQENSQLRVLLKLAKQLKTKVLAAHLLSMAVDNFKQQVTIDKGKLDGLYAGQPVVDAYGLFGQVISVGSEFSKILLVTDVKSAIPVIIVRSGVHAIAVGTGHTDSLELINIPETTDIKEGDVLATSETGKRFPAGYTVGIVRSIKHTAGERFINAVITPSAHINSSRDVLLLWTNYIVQSKK